jgi:hypothetical protein
MRDKKGDEEEKDKSVNDEYFLKNSKLGSSHE